MARPVIIALFILIATALSPTPCLSSVETVSIPLSIEQPMLSALVIKDVFSEPGTTALLLDEEDGCKKVVLSEPRYMLENGRILFEIKVYIKAGFFIGHTCLLPITWEGYISMVQVPVINDKWILSFKTTDSHVLDKNRKPAKVMGLVWNLIKTYVFDYLNGITISLAPPVEELRGFLKEIFPFHLDQRAEMMMNSLRPGRVAVSPNAVTVEILTKTENAVEEDDHAEERSLRPEELAAFITTWEAWDAFFVQMITSISGEYLAGEERDTLLDVFLQARHRFTEELSEQGGKEDFVRKEFVAVWSRLGPLLRKRLIQGQRQPIIDYLSFFTASDALLALDRLGPELGIEISRQGLIRLARLIASADIMDLPYIHGVDERLRDLLGLGPALVKSGIPFEGEVFEFDTEEKIEDSEPADTPSPMKSFFMSIAWAGTAQVEGFREQLAPWLLSKGDLQTYLERVKTLLEETSTASFKKFSFDEGFRSSHQSIVLSTVWQESCFRQFVLKKGKVAYLKSYNGTSVGLMQINERVWRGIYDEKHLRWDAPYNASAGCDILGLYLKKYVLPEMEKTTNQGRIDDDTVARSAYAAYYGGPTQLKKFMERMKKGKPNLMDSLFLEKYHWVIGNNWDRIDSCL